MAKIEVNSQMATLSEKWGQYESIIIDELKKYPPYKFDSKQVVCYVVKNLPYTGISNPLTIRIKAGSNLDLIMSTLIHELVHISIELEESNLVAKIEREFPEVTDFRTQLHVIVNFIEYEILKTLFDKPTLDKIMERELSLKGLKNAWTVVLTNEEKLLNLFGPLGNHEHGGVRLEN